MKVSAYYSGVALNKRFKVTSKDMYIPSEMIRDETGGMRLGISSTMVKTYVQTVIMV